MKVRLRLFAVMAVCGLALPRVAAAGLQSQGIPTLGGIGLGVMAGILAMGGAWAVSRNRDRKK